MNVQRGRLKTGFGICNVTGTEVKVPLSAVDYPHTGMIVINCDINTCTHTECAHNAMSRIRSKQEYLIQKEI